jgi:hypothetical protein
MHRGLGDSSDGECAADLQKMLKMGICILWILPTEQLCCNILMSAGLSSKLPSLIFISGPVLMLARDGAEKSLMHFRVAIGIGSTCGVDP